jgi:hypothetical protein
MSNILSTIESFKRKKSTGGIEKSIISKAEKELAVTFASDYKLLLSNYGFLYVKGEEFLGIDIASYDVVKATKEARQNFNDFPAGMYVVENFAIDGILLLQKASGEVYTYQPNENLKQIASNLDEYLSNL